MTKEVVVVVVTAVKVTAISYMITKVTECKKRVDYRTKNDGDVDDGGDDRQADSYIGNRSRYNEVVVVVTAWCSSIYRTNTCHLLR